MWQAGGCTRCCAHWGDFRAGSLIFGCGRAGYTHLGYFGARGEAGGGAKSFENGFQESVCLIRQAVPDGPVRARICCWACWARFFIAKKMYSSKYNTFISIQAFYVAPGRREWVDGSRWSWMML
jgi:hypothetical protein